jgi:uncharacterized protein involved in exopolysaccharide biosynthesis
LGNIQTLGDVIGLLRRRWFVIALITVLGAAATVVYALSMPRSYEAIAVIQVEQPRVTDEAVRDAAGGPTSFRLQLIEQRIMSRETMLALMHRHGLAGALAGLSEMHQVVVMRSSIRLEAVRTGSGGATDVTAILVTARLGDPVTAAAAANDVAGMIIALGSAREFERIAEARAFFVAEEARITQEIVAIEAAITHFKQANVDALPEATSVRREEMAQLDTALRDIAARRLELDTRREALLAEGNLRTVSARTVEQLAAQIALLEEQAAPLAARRAEVEAALARAPGIETALSAYARSLQLLQDQYAITTRRLAEAEMSRKLAESQKTEQFRLLEAARPPAYATGSGRRRIAALGFVGALMLGLGVALALEMANPVLRTAGQFERAVGIRPVVAIPHVLTAAERVQQRTRQIATLGAAAFVMLAFAAMVGLRMFGA